MLSNIEDVDGKNTKRIRLYNAFAKACNESKCSNQVLKFITVALAPERYVNDRQRFESLRENINQQLAFSELANLNIFLPPLPVQTRIVKFLKAIDLKIEVDRRINDNSHAFDALRMASALRKSGFCPKFGKNRTFC